MLQGAPGPPGVLGAPLLLLVTSNVPTRSGGELERETPKRSGRVLSPCSWAGRGWATGSTRGAEWATSGTIPDRGSGWGWGSVWA
jgi:hypothetical protein